MRRFLACGVAIGLALILVSATQAVAPRKPHLKLLGFTATPTESGFTASMCYRRGPKAFGLVTETLTVDGVVTGTLSTRDPLGWDLKKAVPYHCESYVQSWDLDSSLQGPGEYKVVVRIVDGTGLSNAVSFTRHG